MTGDGGTLQRHAWLQKHPTPLAQRGEFHWFPAGEAGDHELRSSFVERVRGVEPPAVLWQLERGRVAWGQVFSATAPLDGRRYVGLVLSVIEGELPLPELLSRLEPPPAAPWCAGVATESPGRGLAAQALAAVKRGARGDVAGVVRALLSGGAAQVEDLASRALPAWIASIERVLPEVDAAPRCGVWRAASVIEALGRDEHATALDDAGAAVRGAGPRDAMARARVADAGERAAASHGSAAGTMTTAATPYDRGDGAVAAHALTAEASGSAVEPGRHITARTGVDVARAATARMGVGTARTAGVAIAGPDRAATPGDRDAVRASDRATDREHTADTERDRVAELAARAWREPGSRAAKAWTLLCELAVARGESIDRVGVALAAIDVGAVLTADERAEVADCKGVVDVLHAWGRGRLDRSPAAGSLAPRLADLVALRVLARLAADRDAGHAVAEARWYALLSATRRQALLAAVAQRTATLRALVEADHG